MSVKILQDHDFGSVSRILGLQAPASANEPARLADLNAAVEGLAWKDNPRVASQSNVNLASPGATIDGITMVSEDRMLIRNQSTAAQNGIYVWNGDAVPATRALDADTAIELENATTTVDEGTDAGTTWRQTSVNFTLGSDAVNFIAFGVASPSASESTAGIAELATQGEVDTGTDDGRIVTPLKLATWASRPKRHAASVGDGAATQYDVSHNLGTKDTVVCIYRVASPYDTVVADVERTDTNTTRVRFASAPTTNQFRVVTLA